MRTTGGHAALLGTQGSSNALPRVAVLEKRMMLERMTASPDRRHSPFSSLAPNFLDGWESHSARPMASFRRTAAGRVYSCRCRDSRRSRGHPMGATTPCAAFVSLTFRDSIVATPGEILQLTGKRSSHLAI
jgi:hypothetical protein